MSIIMHMENYGDKTKRILELAHNSGVVSTGEVRSQGFTTNTSDNFAKKANSNVWAGDSTAYLTPMLQFTMDWHRHGKRSLKA